MSPLDRLCIHSSSGHAIGVDAGGLQGSAPTTQKNIFGTLLTQHSLVGEDLKGQIAEIPLRFKSVLIDLAAEHLGARRTHAVRTARYAAAPTSNRSLGLKQRRSPYNPCEAT